MKSQRQKSDRFVPPIMQAFRAAFRDKDSEKELNIRSEADERIIAGRRTSPRSVVNEAVLRQELADDLSALCNTVNLAAAEDLSGLDEVQHSILNYGVDDLTAIAADSRHAKMLSNRLLDVFADYEARLVDGTVRVVSDVETDETGAKLLLHISADMYATPSDVPIEFVADVEGYSGKVKIKQS